MGEFSGTDPIALAGAIKKMDSGASTLANSCQSLMSQFGNYGLDTSGLHKLNAIALWTRDQLPDLRRRHALAVAAGKDHPAIHQRHDPRAVFRRCGRRSTVRPGSGRP